MQKSFTCQVIQLRVKNCLIWLKYLAETEADPKPSMSSRHSLFIKPWSNLGILYLELYEDPIGARRWVERALGVDRTYERALHTLALIEQ